MSFIEDKNSDLLTFLSDTIEGAEIAQGSIPEMHDFRLLIKIRYFFYKILLTMKIYLLLMAIIDMKLQLHSQKLNLVYLSLEL